MEKPLLVLKPNLASAIAPIFAKSFLTMLPFGIVLLIIAYLLKLFNIIENSAKTLILIIILGFLVLVFFSMKYKLLMLRFTKYYFYKTHVVSVFKFIKVKRSSLPYTQITNIKIHVSFWDRICGAGKIALNAAGNGAPSLILCYIKDPYEIEKMLHSLIHKYYGDSMGKLSHEE